MRMMALRWMMHRTRIKVCGITNLTDAASAVKSGVDALGFIFVPKSPRYVDVKTARQIIAHLPPFIDSVGVFINEDLKEVSLIAIDIGLTCLQFHGEEDPAYCLEAARRISSCRIIKAFRVGKHSRSEDFVTYNNVVQAFLLDTYVPDQPGGTGSIFDWQLVPALDLQRPVILAGGLCPENAFAAVRTVRPYGIDANSGIERSPGIKDHARLNKLVDQVRLADGDM